MFPRDTVQRRMRRDEKGGLRGDEEG